MRAMRKRAKARIVKKKIASNKKRIPSTKKKPRIKSR